jgi:hypothetical protein
MRVLKVSPIPTIFDCCRPREDVLAASLSDYAADLRSVVAERRDDDYSDPERFFANTFPTEGLRRLLEAAGRRLSRAGNDEGSMLRLDSTFGGGKTHGVIALVNLARTPSSADVSYHERASLVATVVGSSVAISESEIAWVEAHYHTQRAVFIETKLSSTPMPYGNFTVYVVRATSAYRCFDTTSRAIIALEPRAAKRVVKTATWLSSRPETAACWHWLKPQRLSSPSPA